MKEQIVQTQGEEPSRIMINYSSAVNILIEHYGVRPEYAPFFYDFGKVLKVVDLSLKAAIWEDYEIFERCESELQLGAYKIKLEGDVPIFSIDFIDSIAQAIKKYETLFTVLCEKGYTSFFNGRFDVTVE
jgi:hypothetical protein